MSMTDHLYTASHACPCGKAMKYRINDLVTCPVCGDYAILHPPEKVVALSEEAQRFLNQN